MAKLHDVSQFSLLQALHHGHLTDRGTNRSRLNSQSHTRWSLSKCSFQHAFPEMCANPKELHLPVWSWITFSVHEATGDLLLHLKPAKTGRWSYGNQGITLTELLWRYWGKHCWRFGGFQLHIQPVMQFHFRKMWNNETEDSLNSCIHLLGKELRVQLWKTETVMANKDEHHSTSLFDLILSHSVFCQ